MINNGIEGIGSPQGAEIPGLEITGLPPAIETPTGGPPPPVDPPTPEPVVEPIVPPTPPETPPAPAENEPDDEDSMIASIADRVGYALEENEEYPETEEGLASFVQAAIKKQSDANLNAFLDSLPPVGAEFFDYLALGGDPEAFFKVNNPEIDYAKVDLTNADTQKSILRTFYRRMDYTDAEINDTLDELELNRGLEKQAKLASGKLKVIQDKEKTDLITNQKAEAAATEKRITEYWESVDQTIAKGEAKGFKIPVSEQKSVLEYMSKPVEKGLSQFTIDNQQMDTETRILYAMLLKNKFDLSKFVASAAKTQNAQNLRDRIAGEGRKLKSGDNRSSVGAMNLDIGLHNIETPKN